MVIVRVPKHDEISLTTALDAGAAGIIIPHVESAQDVKDIMKEMYFREWPSCLRLRVPHIYTHDMEKRQPPRACARSAHGPSPPDLPVLRCTRMMDSTW